MFYDFFFSVLPNFWSTPIARNYVSQSPVFLTPKDISNDIFLKSYFFSGFYPRFRRFWWLTFLQITENLDFRRTRNIFSNLTSLKNSSLFWTFGMWRDPRLSCVPLLEHSRQFLSPFWWKISERHFKYHFSKKLLFQCFLPQI